MFTPVVPYYSNYSDRLDKCLLVTNIGYGLGVAFIIALSLLMGILMAVYIKGDNVNYVMAGKSFPLWVVAMTLGAQSVDSNTSSVGWRRHRRCDKTTLPFQEHYDGHG